MEGVLPNFGPQPGVTYDRFVTVPLPNNSLVSLARKIVRGLTYIIESKLICDDTSIDVYFVEHARVTEFLARVIASGDTYHRGPGILVQRVIAADNPSMSLWHITILGRLKIWAAVKC